MTSFSVQVDNSGNPGPNGPDLFQNAAQRAADIWAGYLQGFGDIQIKISFADLPGDVAAQGGSATSQYLGSRDGVDLLQQGASYEIQTGRDPNGGDPDLLITVDTGYAASVTAGSSSLAPILLHEIGHGIAFGGFRNQDGSLPSQTYPDGSHHPYELVYDQMLQSSGGSLTFTGQNAERVNGGPVALADVAHLADPNDLMYPVASHASAPSAVDLAVLQDIGLPVATERDDTLSLLSADDRLSAYGGNDTVQASAGSDLVYGNAGQDLIYGNQDADRLYGGQDRDRVYGGQGTDLVYGNRGADLVYGNLGADVLYGGQDDDRLYGGQGDDTLVGGLGNDTLQGGLGADRYVFGPGSGADIVLGYNAGEGDRLDFGGQSVTTSDDGQGGTLYTIAGGASVDVQGLASHTA